MSFRPTVLCIDDYLPGVFVRKIILESHGYAVLIATSGERALSLARKGAIDIVLLDYQMPGRQGDELAGALRRLLPRAPIILFSSAELWEIPVETFRYLDGYIQKSLHPQKWLGELSSIVRRFQTGTAA